MTKLIMQTGTISSADSGLRLDQALSKLFPEYSRSRLTKWLKEKQIKINGEYQDPKTKVSGGELVELKVTLVEEGTWTAQAIDLNIIFEDDDLLVLSKPIGLVVHPGAGNPDSTLVNALLAHAPNLAHLPRAGIVHRLDKDTSGLMMVAKSLPAHTALIQALQKRNVKREYVTIVHGEMTAGMTIDAPIGRHPTNRIKMAVVGNGKPAITHIRIRERFQHFTALDVQLETGRTHQIRVHLSHQKYPIVGDPLYGGRRHLPKGTSESLKAYLQTFNHQALHAIKLSFIHPTTKQPLSFETELPDDIQTLISHLTTQ